MKLGQTISGVIAGGALVASTFGVADALQDVSPMPDRAACPAEYVMSCQQLDRAKDIGKVVLFLGMASGSLIVEGLLLGQLTREDQSTRGTNQQ